MKIVTGCEGGLALRGIEPAGDHPGTAVDTFSWKRSQFIGGAAFITMDLVSDLISS